MVILKLKHLTLFITTLFVFHFSSAQKDFGSGINAGMHVGGAKLLGEMNGFSERIKEFNNQFGIASAVEISKFFTPHFEAGLGFGYSQIMGDLEDPLTLSAQGFHPVFPQPPNQVVNPIEYKNTLIKPNVFLSYYFSNISSPSYFNPFIKAGLGYLSYKSELRYSESGEFIFGKGDENYANLSTAVYNLGIGFKTTITPQFFLKTSVDFNFVNYGLLDVVHNYDEEGNRLEVVGIYSEFKVGIFYTLKPSTSNQKSSKKKGKSNRNNKINSTGNLPFAR